MHGPGRCRRRRHGGRGRGRERRGERCGRRRGGAGCGRRGHRGRGGRLRRNTDHGAVEHRERQPFESAAPGIVGDIARLAFGNSQRDVDEARRTVHRQEAEVYESGPIGLRIGPPEAQRRDFTERVDPPAARCADIREATWPIRAAKAGAALDATAPRGHGIDQTIARAAAPRIKHIGIGCRCPELHRRPSPVPGDRDALETAPQTARRVARLTRPRQDVNSIEPLRRSACEVGQPKAVHHVLTGRDHPRPRYLLHLCCPDVGDNHLSPRAEAGHDFARRQLEWNVTPGTPESRHARWERIAFRGDPRPIREGGAGTDQTRHAGLVADHR